MRLTLLLLLATAAVIAQDAYPPRSFTHFNAGPGTPVIQMEGNRHVFDCVANGFPNPVYAWQKGDAQWIRGNDTFTYRITSLNRSHAGFYRCFAYNALGGLRDLGISFRVGYFDRPADSGVSLTRGAALGGVLQLPLPVVTAFPPPSAVWVSNGFTIDEDARHFIATPTSQLFVLNVSSSEHGYVYQARMTNNYHDSQFILSATYTLVVGGGSPPSWVDPQLLWQSDNITYTSAISRAIVECVFNARPLEYLRIRWYRSQLGSPESMTEITHDGVKYTLEPTYGRRLSIYNLGQTDQGKYACEAQLVTEARTSPVVRGTVWLLMQQAPALMRTEPSDLVVAHGGDRVLQCSATGQPQPAIQWYWNAARIFNSSRFTLRGDGSLAIRSMQPSDAGIYQCFAVNSVDEKYAITWIRVESSPPKIQTPMSANVTRLESEDVSFPCAATGAPTPTIQWLMNNTLITSGGRFQIQSSGSLLITSVRTTDTALYTCLASNTPGSDTTSGYLTVLQRTKIIIPPEKPLETIKGSDLEMKCGFTASRGVSVRVEWYQTPDGATSPIRVVSDDYRSILMETGSLRFTNVRLTDAGRYQCFVFSSAGNDTRDTHLTVFELPQSPTIQTALISPIDNRSVSLVWLPGLSGNTPVTAFSVQSELSTSPDAWNPAATVGGDVTSFRVTGLVPALTYRFRVLARNKVGESVQSFPSASITMPQQREFVYFLLSSTSK